MATTSNILTLLKFYASRQKTALIDYSEFVDYIRRYSQHHLDTNPDLQTYLENGTSALDLELSSYAGEKQIVMVQQTNSKKAIFVIPYYVEKLTSVYKDMEINISVPFPNVVDLPKTFPQESLTRGLSSDLIYKFLENETLSDKYLYCMSFNKGVPSLILPSMVSVNKLLELALRKVQEKMKRVEFYDYFLKKLQISNPGKEVSIKTFFSHFATNPLQSLSELKETGETYFYWSQLCYFLKGDFNKQKEFTPDDVNMLQSVSIIELSIAFFKSRTSERLQKENAFKLLDTYLATPPYYHNMDQIVRVKDSSGHELLTQYTKLDLEEHLKDLTTLSVNNELPQMLIFRLGDGLSNYIFKDKVMPLIVRLVNDCRIIIRDSLSVVWYKYLLEWETLPEMKENLAFESCLQRELASADPVLFAILNSSFLPVVALEDKSNSKINLFRDGQILPYSEILMISRQEVLSSAEIKLPFYHHMPILRWILSLFHRKPKEKRRKDSRMSATAMVMAEKNSMENAKLAQRERDDASSRNERKMQLRKDAISIESKMVPASSTLDRELDSYMREWNDRIDDKSHQNLIDDVNSCIRDYVRRTIRQLRSESFTEERIDALAQSLVDSSSMARIKNHPALKMYVKLYMIKLIKNIP